MRYDSIVTVIILCVVIVAIVGIVMLQMFLSKKENKVAGLILPIVSFIISFVPAVSNTISLINLKMYPGFEISLFSPQLALVYATTFLLLNIPTAMLITIYVAYRKKYRKIKDLNKMSIQDLE